MEIELQKIREVSNIDKERSFKPYIGSNTEKNKNFYNELQI